MGAAAGPGTGGEADAGWEGDAGSEAGAASEGTPGSEPQARAPKPPVTGDQAVDEAMELVSDAFGADLDFQLEAYESAHKTLQERLADVES